MPDFIELQSDYTRLCNYINKYVGKNSLTYYVLEEHNIVFELLLKLCGNDFEFPEKKELNKILMFIFVIPFMNYREPNFNANYYTNFAIYFINNYLDDINMNILGYILKNKKLGIYKKNFSSQYKIRLKIISCLNVPIKYLNFKFRVFYDDIINNRFENKEYDIEYNKILFTDEDILNSCSYILHTEKILFKYFKKNNDGIVSEDILLNIVSTCTPEIFKRIMDLNDLNYNFINEKILFKTCEYLNYDLIEYLLNFNIKNIDDAINVLMKALKKKYIKLCSNLIHNNYYSEYIHDSNKFKIISCIEKLVFYGCYLTYDNILNLTKLRIELSDFEKYNIKFEENFVEVCSDYNFFPYDKHIKHTTKSLEIECSKDRSISHLKKILENNPNLKLTQKCLENACTIKTNAPIINYILYNSEINCNHRCLINIIKSNISKQYVLNLIDNYAYIYKKEQDELEMLRKENIELKNKLSNLNPSKKKKTDFISDDFLIKDNIECKIDKLSIEDPVEDFKLKVIPNTFEYNNKLNWNSKILKELDISSDLSFIGFRNILIKYILKNKLLKQNKIYLNDKLKYILKNNIEKISFRNLNNFIYNLVKV